MLNIHLMQLGAKQSHDGMPHGAYISDESPELMSGGKHIQTQNTGVGTLLFGKYCDILGSVIFITVCIIIVCNVSLL